VIEGAIGEIMLRNSIHIVGFGSQGSAWAQCLRASGWDVQVYLSNTSTPTNGAPRRSYDAAKKLGFEPYLLKDLTLHLNTGQGPQWIAMLCPDGVIAPVYRDFLQSSPSQIRLILAHGYVVYANELNLAGPHHRVALLAPKAIGPKLLQNFQNSSPAPHQLAAAFWADPADQGALIQIASGLGFAQNSLINASFEQEAIGDLISEQGLLCGGVFNLLELTMNAMEKAGIPEALIREECITELELIAGLIRERGVSQSFQAISQAAQCGTASMAEKLEASGIREIFETQAAFVQSREFVGYFRSQKWQDRIRQFTGRLSQWEERFKTLDLRK
jgi:ketol-acid reductoisomerase